MFCNLTSVVERAFHDRITRQTHVFHPRRITCLGCDAQKVMRPKESMNHPSCLQHRKQDTPQHTKTKVKPLAQAQPLHPKTPNEVIWFLYVVGRLTKDTRLLGVVVPNGGAPLQTFQHALFAHHKDVCFCFTIS